MALRPISESEIGERYLSWLNDPEITQYLEARHITPSEQSIVDYINGLRSTEGCELFAIFTKRESVHIGNLGISQNNPHNQGLASYGQMIGDPKAQAMGLGGEVSALIVEFLFQNPNIHKVWGGVHAANVKAWQTSEYLGLRKEGTLRKHAVLPDGSYCDIYQYGILREEWQECRRKFAAILKHMHVAELAQTPAG